MPGAYTHSPADVVRRLLIDLGLGTEPSAASAWPVSAGRQPDLPDNCITVYDTAGRREGRSMVDGEVAEHEGIQVRIRAVNHETGYPRADAIAKALDSLESQRHVTVGGIAYKVWNVSRTSSVAALGKEENSKRNLFTVNAVVSMRKVS